MITGTKRYIFASDFDQTLSFNDSGVVLSQLLGRPEFEERVAGMSRMHLVQPGVKLTELTTEAQRGRIQTALATLM